jgi:hypothetical protein
VRIFGEFRDLAGTLVDPTTVTLKVRTPAAVVTTYTYGGGVVLKDSAGVYHADVAGSEAGTWSFRWEGVGSYVAAGEWSFEIDESVF